MKRKIISLLTVIMLMNILAIHAFAESDISKQSNDTSGIFNITVPVSLPITVDSNGQVIVASNAKITNNGDNPVSVYKLDVKASAGWELATPDKVKNAQIGSKLISMSFNGNSCSTDGIVDVSNFDIIEAGKSINLAYNAIIKPSVLEETSSAATVIITMKTYVPPVYAMIYSDGSMVFQRGNEEEPSKTLTTSYTGFEKEYYTSFNDVPWDSNRSSITSISFKDKIQPLSTAYWFGKMTNLVSFNSEKLDTSNTTDMSYMLYGCSNLMSLDISNFDTSKVTNLNYMLYDCFRLKTIYVSNTWTTSSVISSTDMFTNSESLVGGNGTVYASSNTDATYARIDRQLTPGYFTDKDGLAGIEITTAPTKTQYYDGESFDTSGMIVTATYINGSTKIINDYIVINGDSLTNGQTSVTISYNDNGIIRTTTQEITVASSLTSIEVTTAPSTTLYVHGQSFNSTGMVVKANYSNGDTKTITGYTIINGSSLTYGQNYVTISYTEGNITKTTTQPITVTNPLTKIAITTAPNNTSYSDGEAFNSAGMVVTATYTNNSTKVVTGYTIINGSSLTSGQTYVTISYTEGGVTKTVNQPITVESALDAYALLYDDGSLVFQRGDKQDSTKTLVASYTGFETDTYTTPGNCPWANERTSIKNITFKNKIKPVSTAYWFWGLTALQSFNPANLDTTDVTSMRFMFYNCSSLTRLDLRSFNTSNVTDMLRMFYGCGSLIDLNINSSSFNTQNVNDFGGMFFNCRSLTELNLNNFNTSSCTLMDSMFFGCSNLLRLDLSSFNTSKVTNISSMFEGCTSLTSVNLSSFRTDSLQKMVKLFSKCTSITHIDLSNFDTSGVTNMTYVFNNCSSLVDLNISSFNTSNVTNMTSMFYGCSAISVIDISSFNTGSVKTAPGMFYGCTNLKTIYASNLWTNSSITSSARMFTNCNNLKGDIAFNSAYVDKTYAITSGGYMTYKAAPSAARAASVMALNFDPDTGEILGYDLAA